MAPHDSKKRKRKSNPTLVPDIDTSKPTAVFKPGQGRTSTTTVALPGSIIANAQTHDLKSALAGQIARVLAVFCVDEVVVFDDGQGKQPNNHGSNYTDQYNGQNDAEYSGFLDPNYFLMHLLSYLETPPHLRIYLFPLHPNLRTAGALPSLDMPHHLRSHEWCQYREGVTLEAPNIDVSNAQSKKPNKSKTSENTAPSKTHVHAGFQNPVSVPGSIPPNTRVTLKFSTSESPPKFQTADLAADAVAPSAPREEAGYYWGYTVRAASSLSNVFTECTFDGGYDLTFGTSERGIPLSSLTQPSDAKSILPEYKHMLIVFGGVAGLEAAVDADLELVQMGVKEPEKLFDHWVNLCPGQGSRTIRTEEAVWLGLMGLRDVVLNQSLLL